MAYLSMVGLHRHRHQTAHRQHNRRQMVQSEEPTLHHSHRSEASNRVQYFNRKRASVIFSCCDGCSWVCALKGSRRTLMLDHPAIAQRLSLSLAKTWAISGLASSAIARA